MRKRIRIEEFDRVTPLMLLERCGHAEDPGSNNGDALRLRGSTHRVAPDSFVTSELRWYAPGCHALRGFTARLLESGLSSRASQFAPAIIQSSLAQAMSMRNARRV